MADFFQDIKRFANNAVDDTKDAAQKAKLNNKISNETQMIDRNMVEIGRYYYEKNKDNPPQELAQTFGNVRVLMESIAVSRAEIQNIDGANEARRQAQQAANTNYGYQQAPNMNYGGYQQAPNMNGGYQQAPNMNGGYQQALNMNGGYQQASNMSGSYQQAPNMSGSCQQAPNMGAGRPEGTTENTGNTSL